MNNHVHMIAVPNCEYSFAKSLGQTQKYYANIINKCEGWSGHLWQDRFLSFPLNERHLYAAVRYVENNPVRSGLVNREEEFAWSSARVHVEGVKDYLISEFYLCRNIHDWAAYLKGDLGEDDNELIRKYTKTGRPLDDSEFVSDFMAVQIS